VSYVIVYRPEDFLRREEEAGHFPYCHFKVHLRELEYSGVERFIVSLHSYNNGTAL